MYRATIGTGQETFFRTDLDLPEYKLTSCRLRKIAGKAGSLTLTIPPGNIAFDRNKLQKVKTWVRLYRDEKQLFTSRIYSLRDTFDTRIAVECEGIKAILSDAVIRPFEYNGTLNGLLQRLLDDVVEQTQIQIELGNITVTDKNDYIYRNYKNYEKAIERFDALVENYGGYMDIVERDGKLYLDWLESFVTQNTQKIEFGENLLDITISDNSDEIITALIPLGKQLTTDDGQTLPERLTISEVNFGSDTIFAPQEYIDRYGYIYGCIIWDDITLPANLLAKGNAELTRRLEPEVQIEVTSVDLNNCDKTIEAFDTGNLVVANSKIHGINNLNFGVQELTLDCLNPSADRMVLSTKRKGFIQSQKEMQKNNISAAVGIGNANVSAELFNKIQSTSQELQNRVIEARSEINKNGDNINALLERITQLNSELTSLSLQVQANASNFGLYFGENGAITNWFNFENSGYFTIGRADSKIISRQDNNNHEFVDGSGNVLLRINSEMVSAQTLSSNQIKLYAGTPDASTEEWAIRLGATHNNKHNLDVLWIGG